MANHLVIGIWNLINNKGIGPHKLCSQFYPVLCVIKELGDAGLILNSLIINILENILLYPWGTLTVFNVKKYKSSVAYELKKLTTTYKMNQKEKRKQKTLQIFF